ncbi:MAG TPA: ComEC/Rec2 family competence protein, partial [Miltoncostaeaceae bacterium]|nr:ComEC/Rec2 family competence protein [Miltoncostaeaceae bacterium]
MGRPALAPLALRLAPHGLALAVIGGLVCSLAFTPPVRWATAALLLSGLGAGAAGRGRRAGTAMALIALALGLAGLGWGAARLDRAAPQAIETFGWGDATVVVDTPPAPDRRGRQRMRAVVETIGAQAADPATRGARILLSLPGGRAVAAGDRLRVAGRLRPAVEAGDPGWWRAWLERQGISGRLASAGVRRIGRRGGPAGWRDVWRNWATDHVAPGLEGDTAGLVRGMALGGGARLSTRTADDFRDAGIWHLLAVSGQNVTVVCLAVLAVLRALGLAQRPALVLSGVVMGAYVLACDGGASVARAGTVGAPALVGELLERERDPWLTLLVRLALLLAWQPRDLLDPGLQLSFAAVCGLFALTEPLAARLRPWTGRRLAQLAGASLAASLATAPVVAGHFGRLSLIGLPVNLVAVPLAAPIVVIALAGLPAGALFPPAGALCAALAGWGGRQPPVRCSPT